MRNTPRRSSRRTFLAQLALVPVAAVVTSVAGADALAAFAPRSPPPAGGAAPLRRRALLIGVHQYQKRDASGDEVPGPWTDLNTVGDVWAIKRVLQNRFGFKNEEIKVLLTPSETTREAILAAIRSVLVAPAKPGDTLFLHYSGHGGEQYTPDGALHQTLVPSNWREEADEAGSAQNPNHILDTEIGELLTMLKQNLRAGQAGAPKSSVTLVFDCCHSGFLTAGTRGKRGVGTPQLRGRDETNFPLKRPRAVRTPPKPSSPGATAQSRGAAGQGLLPLDATGGERGFVALLACRYDQKAGEIEPVQMESEVPVTAGVAGTAKAGKATTTEKRPMGRLSFFLAQALDQAGERTTYRDVFEQVRGKINARYVDQNPVIEGDQNNLLLQGLAVPAPRYLNVSVEATSEEENATLTVFLQAGKLQGVTPQSEFALYPAGTSDFKAAKPLARAVVANVELTRAKLAITPVETGGAAPAPRALIAARALVTRLGVEGEPLRVNLSALATAQPAVAQALRDRIKDIAGPDGLLEITSGDDPGQVKIIPGEQLPPGAASTGGARAGALALVTQPDQTVADLLSPQSAAAMASALRESLLQMARARALRGMEYNERPPGTDPTFVSDGVQIEIRLVPVQATAGFPPTSDEDVRLSAESLRLLAASVSPTAPSPPGANKSDWRLNERFVIQARNTGKTDAYLTILEILPNGEVGGVWPRKQDSGKPKINFLPLNDNKWKTLTVANEPYALRITEPLGAEHFKAIATREPTDFTPLVDYSVEGASRSRAADGQGTPLGQFFQLAREGKRGTKGGLTSKAEDVGTATIPFRVVDGKVAP